MQRYFRDFDENIFSLASEDSYHIIKVMRQKIGDMIEVVNKRKMYICEIIDIKNNEVVVKVVEEKEQESELACEVTIAQSLVKEQKMDLILQKCCELGVKEVIPIKASRSVVKIDKDINKKIERWNRILKEASEQSKRVEKALVNKVIDISTLAKEQYDIKILCTVNEMSTTIKKVLSNGIEGAKIIVVIGPEGGFSNEEEKILIDNGFIPTSLGSRVLRTETASLYVLSIINYVLMR